MASSSRTPSPLKARIGDPKSNGSGTLRPVAVERVVSNAGTVMEFPMLTRANYHEWALVMQVNLEALGLWGVVESADVERREDRLAMTTIVRAVPAEMKAGMAKKKSAKEVWAAVKTIHMGDACVLEVNAQRLLKAFENVAFKDGESIDEFAMRLRSLVTELGELGETMEEVRVVKKMLCVMPAKYSQVAVSIKMLMDLLTMTLEELVGRLRVAEDRAIEEAAVASGVEQLLLTEEQWEARRRQRGKERVRRGGGSAKEGGHDHDNDDDGGAA